ncbi:hypothetical protein PGT21_033643 [Puccinia graminis f. sp. tritici]|uniref:Uncharacterized protein n=1 Tax=Puccinia graminis f. sp. tritici TaxID=56615 RepID=A0A5B0R2M4_PUCGR|nr:hypothetical protein PGT21_033643 [Puccinia graminis f. sp. tritici]
MVLLLRKISKKHLQVGARTWRPPPRDHLRNRSVTLNIPISTTNQQTTTDDQPAPPPPEAAEQEQTHTQTQTQTQTDQPYTPANNNYQQDQFNHPTEPHQPTSSHSQNYQEHPYSQSLNDTHLPTGSYPSEYNRQTPNAEQQDYPDPNHPHSQSYHDHPQIDSSHHQDIPSVHPQDSASQSAHHPPQNRDYASSCGLSDIGRERLRIAEAEHQAALQRVEEAKRKNPLIELPELHHSDTDLKLQQNREQLEENRIKLEEIRKAQELLDLREKEVRLREEQLIQMLQEERQKKDEEDRIKQQEAERTTQELKEQAEQERLRAIEAIRRDSLEKEELTRKRYEEEMRKLEKQARQEVEEEFRQQKRREEEELRELKRREEEELRELKRREEEESKERARREQEAEMMEQMERLRIDEKEKQENEAKIRAQLEAQSFAERTAEQNAKLTMREQLLQRELAMQNIRCSQSRKRAELLAMVQPSVIRSISPVSYAGVYSSPILCGYELPSFPPTPRSPHLVPEKVRKAARADQKWREREQIRLQELELAQQREAERLWEEHQRQAANRGRPDGPVDRRDEFPVIDPGPSHSARSDNNPDHHYSNHRSPQPAQSALNEHSNNSHHRSRQTPIDRRDQLPHRDERSTHSAQSSHHDHHNQSPDRKSQRSHHGTQGLTGSPQPVDLDNSIHIPGHRSPAVRASHNENPSSQRRPHSVGRRDELPNMDTRLTRSAKSAQLDYSMTAADRGSQAGPVANSSTSSQQPLDSNRLENLARVKAELERRERDTRRAEDAEIAAALAAFNKAKEKAQAHPTEDSERSIPEEHYTVGPPSHPSDQAVDQTLAAKKRAAEAAAYFMTKQTFSNPTRRRKTSMPHAASHRQATSYHHQRFNSTETASIAPSETISEFDSIVAPASLDKLAGHQNVVFKEIETSIMLQVGHPSPIDYLENHPRGRRFKMHGDQLVRHSLSLIAKGMGADSLEDIRLRDPVFVKASGFNFSAQGIAVIRNNRSPGGTAGLDDCNPPAHHTPRQLCTADPLDSTTHKPSTAHHDPHVAQTPGSSKSEPFDHSESVQASPKPHHPPDNFHSPLSSKHDEPQGPAKVDREVQTSIGSSATGQPHSSASHSNPNLHDSHHEPTHSPSHRPNPHISHNEATHSPSHRPRDLYSPRVLEEERHINALEDVSSERPHTLPAPPRFTIPKVTLQSPSDTTSPTNPDDHTFSATPNNFGNSSPVATTSSSPTKQSTSSHHPRSAGVTAKIPFQSPSDTTSPTNPDDTPLSTSSQPFGISSPISTSHQFFPSANQPPSSPTRSPPVDLQRPALQDQSAGQKPSEDSVDRTFCTSSEPFSMPSPVAAFHPITPKVIIQSPSDTTSPTNPLGSFPVSPQTFNYSSPAFESYQSSPPTQARRSQSRSSSDNQHPALQEDLSVRPRERFQPDPQQNKTPRQIPLPPESPWEKPLPPPTPREFPLPASPSFSEVDRNRRSQSYDFKNFCKIGIHRTSSSSSSSSTSSGSLQRLHRDRAPSRLSGPWIGDQWDVLRDNLVGIHKPISPVPVRNLQHPRNSHRSPSNLKQQINSLPFIQMDEDTRPN